MIIGHVVLTGIEPVMEHFDSCSYNWGHCLVFSVCRTARRRARPVCTTFLAYSDIRH